MSEPKTPYRLGLDIGANSIGWAALALDANGDPCGVLAMGSRVFPDGRAPETRSGPGASLAVGRRLARGQRRRRRRYLRRRDRLMKALVAYGLMPASEKERKALARRDPYALRKRALSEPLAPYDLGRALFHLNQRRGFKSNRKAGGAEDKKKATQARLDRDGLRDSLGDRQLGEYLADRRERRKPVRARPGQELYPERAMYEREFDEMRARQAEHHALASAQWDELRHIIFFQRPLISVKPGLCALEKGERRAPRAHPDAQEFRILQEVNNLRLRENGGAERPLNEGERKRVLNRLRQGKDIDLQNPTKGLELPEGAALNLARGGRKRLKGDETTARLAAKKIFGTGWFGRDDRAAIVEFLIGEEDPEVVREKAERDWGMSAEQARRLAMTELPSGYFRLSLKAIRKVLPYLEEGLGEKKAVEAAGYPDSRNAEAHDRLPYYGVVLERDVVGADCRAPESDEVKHWGRFPNPTVHVGLNQLRRVGNRLIEVYGKPEDVVVELARGLKMNKDQRKALQKAQQEGEERNKRFEELLGREPSYSDKMRLRLWEEQGGVCVYTGKRITLKMAVGKSTHIDHILPFSRTLDNGRGNMVLCLAGANRDKGDKTPSEKFSGNPQGYDYEAILARADALPGKRGWRFREGAMERFEKDDKFLDRHLNETAYLSRTACRYLAYLYDEKSEGRVRVRAVPGRMTALLRNGLRRHGVALKPSAAPGQPSTKATHGKSREDHRHHAVDAFVVANTTQGMLKRFADASANGTAERLAEQVPPPWPGFDRKKFQKELDKVVISYKPDHGSRDPKSRKTSGQLHKDTAYGLMETPGNGPIKVVTRKPLADFAQKKELDAVRDPKLRQTLQALWDETGGNRKRRKESGGDDGDGAPSFADKARDEGVLMNGRLHFIRRVRVVEKWDVLPVKDESGKAYKGYVRGGNEFADIWRIPVGKDKDGKRRKAVWKIVVVPTFEFNQRGFDEKEFKPHPAAKRLTRIHRDDMAALGEGAARIIVRVRKISGGKEPSIVLDPHKEANVAKRAKDPNDSMKENVYRASKLMEKGFRKVSVDEIGRLRDPGPFPDAAAKEPGEPKSAKRKPAARKPLQQRLF